MDLRVIDVKVVKVFVKGWSKSWGVRDAAFVDDGWWMKEKDEGSRRGRLINETENRAKVVGDSAKSESKPILDVAAPARDYQWEGEKLGIVPLQ